MGRWGGYGRRTVEQTRGVDIDALRRAGFIGKPRSTWWVHRQRLFREGIRPTHWSDNAITLDGQSLSVARIPWHYGGQRIYFRAPAAGWFGSSMPRTGSPGVVVIVTA